MQKQIDITINDINFSNIKYNKNVNFNQFREIVLSGIFQCIYDGRNTIFTTSINVTNKKKSNIVFILSKTDFHELLSILYFDFIKNFCQKKNTVKTFNFHRFKILFPILVILFISFLNVPHIDFALKTIIILYYSLCVLIKSYYIIIGCITRDDFELNNDAITIQQKELPKYTILIPMFKENHKTILQSLKAIKNIEYPKNLLDVKFVLEKDDIKTLTIINDIKLPNYITTIHVPYFEPRTKPKACNFASLFAEGEIVVIFDAEDVADKKQLMDAIKLFKKTDADILQGCLTFYNFRKNLLTECFNIEYTVWFKMALKIFSDKGITIPLGGTSNHIKYSFLEKNNFWDSYNVTEDLELSVIANKNCAEIKHLQSDTKEWCVVDIKSFIKQRTRWQKGYLLTYLIHFFDKKNISTIKDFIFSHVIIGYTSLSFLLTPFLFFSLYTIQNNILIIFWSIINLLYYSTYCFIYASMIRNIDILLTWKRMFVFLIYPFYFILHIISSYFALIEIFTKPFYWSKTEHLNDKN